MDQNEENEKLDEILKKHYFSIDLSNTSGINNFIKDMLYGPQIDDTLYQQLNNFTDAIFASFGNNYAKDSVIFIGNNSYGEPVFKQKHFIVDELYTEYLNHIRAQPAHTLQQPDYYKNLHEILN